MARVKVHPHFYDNYKKGEFCNICPICGTEGYIVVGIKTELDVYTFVNLQKGGKVPLKKSSIDAKSATTVRCKNCEMNLLYTLMKGDVDIKDMDKFNVARPIKTRELIDKLDSMMEE